MHIFARSGTDFIVVVGVGGGGERGGLNPTTRTPSHRTLDPPQQNGLFVWGVCFDA